MADTFCDVCHFMLQTRLGPALEDGRTTTHMHHTSPHALFAASRRCYICRDLWIAGRSHLQNMAQTQTAQKYSQENPVYCAIKALQDIVETVPRNQDDFDPPIQSLKTSKTWLELSFRWSSGSYQGFYSYHLLAETTYSALVGNHQPSMNVDSPATWSLCEQWIQDCFEHHVECGPSKTTSDFRPTRLLELSKKKNEVWVRLIISIDEPPVDSYSTLSHCWGGVEVIKLTHATWNSLKSGMDGSRLPRLYQDAIAITLSLGIHHLWIDSLCIIQDGAQEPTSDWLKESKLMGLVYSNSFCNIAASGSANSHEEVLHSRNPAQIRPRKVTIGQLPGSPLSFYLYPSSLCQIDPDEPLGKRGWVLQEQLLPTRTLVFTKQQVHWQCRSKEACESFPGGMPPTLHGEKLLLTSLPSRPISQLKRWLAYDRPVYFSWQASFDKSMSPWESFWTTWKCIVEDYSARYITHSSDKLVAIAGLASTLVQKMSGPSRYMAGMWSSSSTVIYELGWTVGEHSNGEPASRPKAYRAPTWAWPSMDGTITYTYKREFYMTGDSCQSYVKGMEIVTVDGSIAGPVKSGFLDIQGPLQKTQEFPRDVGPEDNLTCASRDLYHLPMVSIYNSQMIWGLILRRIESGTDQGCYRRVGLFHIGYDFGDEKPWDELRNTPEVTIRIV